MTAGEADRGTTPVRARPIDDWAELFGAMADGNRLRLLVAVHYRPGSNVTELAEAAGMSANATSHALAGLRMRGIVRSEPAGRERRWWVVSDDVHQLLHFVGAPHAAAHGAHHAAAPAGDGFVDAAAVRPPAPDGKPPAHR